MADNPAPSGSAPVTPPTPTPATITDTANTNTTTTTTTTSTPSVCTTTTNTTAGSKGPDEVLLEKAQEWIHEINNLKVKVTGVEGMTDLEDAIDLAKDQNELLDLMLIKMGRKGLSTDTSPKIGIMTPCEVPSHIPKISESGNGVGFFVIPGNKLSTVPWDKIKADPGAVLKSDRGCGYEDCSSDFWTSVESYADKYPSSMR